MQEFFVHVPLPLVVVTRGVHAGTVYEIGAKAKSMQIIYNV